MIENEKEIYEALIARKQNVKSTENVQKENENTAGSLYYSALDIKKMLGVSRGKAYQIVKNLNEELGKKGYIVIAGKIPKQFFNEHFYGLSQQNLQIAGPKLA